MKNEQAILTLRRVETMGIPPSRLLYVFSHDLYDSVNSPFMIFHLSSLWPTVFFVLWGYYVAIAMKVDNLNEKLPPPAQIVHHSWRLLRRRQLINMTSGLPSSK